MNIKRRFSFGLSKCVNVMLCVYHCGVNVGEGSYVEEYAARDKGKGGSGVAI